MTDHILEIKYGGATLKLEIRPGNFTRLLVNGILREEKAINQSSSSELIVRLSSTVQTDYEWHEFIEALVTISEGRISAKLIANNTEIAHENYPINRG
ncbi:MAG: hypothetical protein VB957_19445 [Pseudomonadales bacterium]|jgi:hypothetical protein